MVDLKEQLTFKTASGSWVVAKRDVMAPSQRSGIVLTRGGMAELQKEVATGTVLACGPGLMLPNGQHQTRPCSGGDRIIWSRYGERVVREDEDGDLVAIPFQEVVGVIA